MTHPQGSDRRNSARTRREDDARLRALFDNALDAILIADNTGRYVDANPAACVLLGYSRVELLQLTVWDLTPVDVRDRVERQWREFGAAGRQSGEYALQRKDGAERVVEYRAVADFLPGLHLSIMRDITERRKAEQRLTASTRRLQQLSRRLFSVQEQERRALARELHDDFGQQLTALKLNLAALKRDVPATDQQLRLIDCLDIVEHTIEHIRDIARDLRPSVLDDLGLAAALHWFARRQTERAACKVTILDHLRSLPPEIETTAFRIVQEAVSNALRHGAARQITVTAKICDRELRLAIQDDGDGFDPATTATSHDPGIGLGSMRERAELLDGRFALASQPGLGTRIEVTIPLPATAL